MFMDKLCCYVDYYTHVLMNFTLHGEYQTSCLAKYVLCQFGTHLLSGIPIKFEKKNSVDPSSGWVYRCLSAPHSSQGPHERPG